MCVLMSVLEGCGREDFDPKKKLDSLLHLAELCIEVIQQNEEYHAEVSFRSFRAVLLESQAALLQRHTSLLCCVLLPASAVRGLAALWTILMCITLYCFHQR